MGRLIFFLLCFLYPFSANAFSYGKFISCNSINPMPKVVFKASYGKLNYHFDKNVDQLSAMLTDENHKDGTFRAGGLAMRPFFWYVRLKKGETKYIAKDVYCVYPTEIEVFVGYKNPTIYVANDYRPGDFWYALTLRHEQTHQWINKLTLEYFLPLFYKRVVAAAREVRAVKVYSSSQEDINAGYKKIREYYEARLEPVVDEFKNILKNEQRKLDNKTNYGEEQELYKKFKAKKKLMEKYDT